jgi:NAD(P)H-dependent FMN reductase
MKQDTQVVALCGSLRDESKTRIALGEALEAAQQAGATTDLVDLRSYDLPPLDTDDTITGDAEALRAAVQKADAVLLGTPNYHGSYSGVLKNALDYCGRDEFEETTIGLLEVAAGDFPGPTLHHLRAVCRVLNAWTLPLEVAIPNSYTTIGEEGIADDDLAERVHQLGEELVAYAGVERFREVTDRPAEAAAGNRI